MTLSIGDVTRELSPESLAEFGVERNKPIGKFVRLGEIIVIAPVIPELMREFTHASIIMHFFREHSKLVMAERQRIWEEFKEHGTEPNLLAHESGAYFDAGWYVSHFKDGALNDLLFKDESMAFGRPSLDERIKTGELARAVVGPEVTVLAEL